ncbi:MAG TPA: anthranilate phosphoribosyltransferase [Acidimicrobiales bacterium]|nr:anthranilate phosphoribosyltransferase [Acidimicrobiales bacterium]
MSGNPGSGPAGRVPAGDRPSLDALGGWPAVLTQLAAGSNLGAAEAGAAMSEVLEGNATPAQIAAFVFGLRCKGETVEEMTGLVAAMIAASERVPVGPDLAGRLVDTCGTGGDRSGTINVSTIAALVVAAAGVPVCKHGGRAASSRAGSADVLEELGVVIDLGPAGVARCIAETGIGFCFAPRYHPAMRHAIPIRRELGVPTAFNFLGPLANPARVRRQVVGVGDPAMAPRMVRVLAAGGAEHVLVVHGADGLDELSTTGPSTVHEFRREPGHPDGGVFSVSEIDPGRFGLPRAQLPDLRGGDAATNAELSRRVLAGVAGPHRDIVVLNAAAGLVVGDRCADLAEGMAVAEAVIDDGRAAGCLERLVSVSQAAARR